MNVNKTIMKTLGYDMQLANIEQGLCAVCGEPVKRADLRDDISRAEFDISGLCQKCQDATFGTGDE